MNRGVFVFLHMWDAGHHISTVACKYVYIRIIWVIKEGRLLKNFKSLFMGIIIGALITGSISVYALTGTKPIEVIYNNIKITLDGKVVNMDVEPFQYEGRTFVPVKFVSEALGANVKWNAETKTVEIKQIAHQDPISKVLPNPTPSPAPTLTPTTTPQITESKEIIVYITKTGEKYHSAGCRYLSKSQIPINLQSAKNLYSPCSVCNPPR